MGGLYSERHVGGNVHDDGQHDLLLRPEWRAGWLGYQNRLVMRR